MQRRTRRVVVDRCQAVEQGVVGDRQIFESLPSARHVLL
jgi:hypothetical protein